MSELSRSPPFRDSHSLESEYIRMALDVLVKRGEARWLDANKSVAIVWWTSPAELAKLIWDLARRLTLEHVFVSDIIDVLMIPRAIAEEILEQLVRQGMAEWCELNGERIAVRIIR